MKKQFLILFAFISVLAFSQVPQRFNKVIVTGDITSPKFIKTGSNADSVLLGNGSARAISTIKTDTVSLSNRINAKATGNGTANGTNTGDETLTSIKTKLGAATPVSDGYLKYQDFALLHTPTTVTAANGLSISGQNISLQNASLKQSGALTFNDWNTFNSKEPAITKNSGFNKNFGTTTGTVLEGRTFGTAAGSAVGDFIQNNSSSAQSANIWISGNGYFGGNVLGNAFKGLSGGDVEIGTNTSGGSSLIFSTSLLPRLTINGGGAATFASTVNSTGFLLNGNNLTSSLSNNYIPKWNGSSMVNSLISDDGAKLIISYGDGSVSNIAPGGISFNRVINTGGIYDGTKGAFQFQHNDKTLQFQAYNGADLYQFLNVNVNISSTTPSTSPTTGALVVNGGVGADHMRANNFYGNGSNLTGVQRPITLTTNGTSGAATFSGNVLNVPNYTSSGGVDQTLTTVNGSTSGNMVCSMPFQTGSYKKVIIYVNSLNGSATYTFPTQLNNRYSITTNTLGNAYTSVLASGTSVTINGATNAAGVLIIEGY